MPVQDSTLFIDRLGESGLLDAARLAQLERLPEAKDPDPRVLARVVFQRGWLTRFQLSAVAAGRAKDLDLGPYRLLDRLGEGGMGQVFKARHERMGRIVALKVIRKDKLGNDQAVQRFFQEVQAAAQLHHPNIVVAYDAGSIGAIHYLSMEFVDGPDLARLIKDSGPLRILQACDFVRQAALGLQHAHERGIVHRDIKPSNLLLAVSRSESSNGTESSHAGTIKILDMGLARWHEPGKDRGLTKSGAVIGTPDYLAPEQALDASSADIRADLYSLGCTLYFLLTGQPPFQGESLTELLLKHQMDQPAPLEKLRPDAPSGVVAVVRRLMAKRADERYPTPPALISALETCCVADGVTAVPSVLPVAEPADMDTPWRALSDEGLPRIAVSATTAADPIPARKERSRAKRTSALTEIVQRRPSWLPWTLAGAGVFFVFLFSLVIVLIVWIGHKEQSDTSKVSRSSPSAPAPMKENLPPVEKQKQGADDPQLAPPPNEKQPAEVVKVAVPAPADAIPTVKKPRAVPQRGKPPRALGEERLFNRQVGAVTALVASQDGRFALVATTEKGVWVLDIDKGKLQKPLPYRFPAPVENLGLTPDGAQLVALYPDKLHLWSLTTGRPTIRRSTARFVSPDGGYALNFIGPAEQQVAQLWDVVADKESHNFSGAPVEPVSAAIVPECKRLVLGSAQGEVFFGDWAAKTSRRWKLEGEGAVTVALAKQGHRLVTSSTGFGICVWDAQSGKLLRRLEGQTAATAALAISDDGRFVVAGGEDSLIRLWHTGSGSVLQEYQGHKGAVTRITLINNERFLSGGADATVRLWRMFPTNNARPTK
jgi:serine/threonine protein kinase